MDYVNSLNEAAEYWYYTFYPEKCTSISDEEQVWLDKLNRIGIGYFRPMMAVSLIPRLGYSKEERIAFFKAAERFIFINFRMAMYQSSYKSSDYYRKTREVYTGNMPLSEVTEDLNATTDGNAKDAVRVFLTRMNRRFISADGFYSWRDLRYFLYEYEYTLATKYKLEKLSWALLTKVVKDRITVEHILPQTPTKLYWRNNFRQFTDEEIKMLSSSLGNMLPLSQSINSSNTLYLVIKEFAPHKGYLGPDKIGTVDCGYIFEDLVRRFSESFGEEAGAHFTSRDIIYLMTDLLLSGAEMSKQENVTVYENCTTSLIRIAAA